MNDVATSPSIPVRVWREASSRRSVPEILQATFEHLGSRGAEWIALRRWDGDTRSLETVAWALSSAQGAPRASGWPNEEGGSATPLPSKALPLVFGSLRVVEGQADAENGGGALLAPRGTKGHYLAGMLTAREPSDGIVVVGFRSRPTEDDRALLADLLEPFSLVLRRALEGDGADLGSELMSEAQPETLETPSANGIVGEAGGLKPVIELVECVARTKVPVLILGETGVGKEVVARSIHERSDRVKQPMIKVNCGAIPAELIDSELFGHERGSFTGAVASRKGWFERAHGGTLFLDEVGELPPAAQVRLLRVLQDGGFERVGGQKAFVADVRIIAATHRDLSKLVKEGRFRRDLWYRISVFPVYIPPLRDRRGDIELLARHFAAEVGRRLRGVPVEPVFEDIALLQGHNWPGNVRELMAVVERACILGGGARLETQAALELASHEPTPTAPPISGITRDGPIAPIRPLDEVVIEHIERALRATDGRIEGRRGAAAILGINPHTLRARMRKLGISWAQYRALSHVPPAPAPKGDRSN